MKIESISKEISHRLADYLDSQIRFREVIEEWPEANRQLKFPCLSIIAGSPEFTPHSPYELKPVAAADSNNRADIKYLVGNYNFSIQLDIWCKSAEERHDMQQKVFDAFHSQNGKPGLSLNLRDYHDIICHYVLNGYDFQDSEESSQRKEWRLRCSVLGNCVAVYEKPEYIITQEPEVNLDVTEEELS